MSSTATARVLMDEQRGARSVRRETRHLFRKRHNSRVECAGNRRSPQLSQKTNDAHLAVAAGAQNAETSNGDEVATSRTRDSESADWRRLASVAINRAYVWSVLISSQCADCGEDDPLVLEFDHQRDKKKNVSAMLSQWLTPLKDIKAEVAKCIVRCANCHSRKTAIAGNNWRARRLAKEQRHAQPDC